MARSWALRRNGYPQKLIDQVDRQVRAQAHQSHQSVVHNDERPVYLTLPFIDDDTCRRVEGEVKKSGVACKISWTNKHSLKRQLVRSDMRGAKCPISRGKCVPCASGLDGKCATNNVVYEIRCTSCGATYIGECIRPVRDRFYDHRRAVYKRDADNPVGNHFRTHHQYDVLPEIPITVSILAKCTSHVDRKLRETMCIRDMKPVMNANISSWWTLDR